MNKAFEKHRDKKLSEKHEREFNNKYSKETIERKTFGQRVKKAWKNINEKKN